MFIFKSWIFLESVLITKSEDTNILHGNTDSANESFSSQPRKLVSLSITFLPEVNIPPKEHVTYTKQTQTTQTGLDRDGNSFLLLSNLPNFIF